MVLFFFFLLILCFYSVSGNYVAMIRLVKWLTKAFGSLVSIWDNFPEFSVLPEHSLEGPPNFQEKNQEVNSIPIFFF